MLFFVLINGFFSDSLNYAPYIIPFHYINIFRWTFEFFIKNEFTSLPLLCKFNNGVHEECKLSDFFSFGDSNESPVMALCLILLGSIILGIIFLWQCRRIKVK